MNYGSLFPSHCFFFDIKIFVTSLGIEPSVVPFVNQNHFNALNIVWLEQNYKMITSFNTEMFWPFSELQENLIRSHAAGVGPALSLQKTRMLLALRINVLAKGYSGISLETLLKVIDAFNGNCEFRYFFLPLKHVNTLIPWMRDWVAK